MNYLAHLFLAGESPELMVGHMLGGKVKPRDVRLYPAAIRAGIRMHQRVDSFTDSHPVVGVSKNRIHPAFRRYGGILVDVFYDHFLAIGWRQYSPEVELEDFPQRAYRVLSEHASILPPRLRGMLAHMIGEDRLTSYRSIRGIDRTLKWLSGRLKSENPLREGVRELREHYEALGSDFAAFFPELIRFVRQSERHLAC